MFPPAGLDKPDHYAMLRLDVKSMDGQPLGRVGRVNRH